MARSLCCAASCPTSAGVAPFSSMIVEWNPQTVKWRNGAALDVVLGYRRVYRRHLQGGLGDRLGPKCDPDTTQSVTRGLGMGVVGVA